MMKTLYISLALVLACCFTAAGQVDRHDVRAGNRKFRKESFKEAEIDYRKAVVKDSTSMAGEYNLANTLYRQNDFEGAGKSLEVVKESAAAVQAVPLAKDKAVAEQVGKSADYFYNLGDVALQKKDYAAAVDAFKEALLRRPEDIDAKENYIYAKLMLQNQQNGGGGGQNDQNQDQNDQDQDQQDNQNNQDNQDQQDQNNQDQDQDNQDQQDQNQGQQPQESKISPQQAQQMLQAVQAKEKETQDKVNKEKAAILQSRQKEKNW